MTFNNKVYDVLKWLAQYLLPAAGALYFALAQTWSLPYAEQVVGTIAAVDTFIGVLLGISSANYEGDGELSIKKAATEIAEVSSEDSSVELYKDLDELQGRKSLLIRVVE